MRILECDLPGAKMTHQGPARSPSCIVLAGCFRLVPPPHTKDQRRPAFIPLGLFDLLEESQKRRDGRARGAPSGSTYSPGVVFPLTDQHNINSLHYAS